MGFVITHRFSPASLLTREMYYHRCTDKVRLPPRRIDNVKAYSDRSVQQYVVRLRTNQSFGTCVLQYIAMIFYAFGLVLTFSTIILGRPDLQNRTLSDIEYRARSSISNHDQVYLQGTRGIIGSATSEGTHQLRRGSVVGRVKTRTYPMEPRYWVVGQIPNPRPPNGVQ